MKKTTHRLVGILLALLIIMSLPLSILAESTAAEVASGTTGDVTWKLDAEGVFTLSGTGATADYINGGATDAPWYEYMASIKKVVVEEGVTALGSRLFYGAVNLTDVQFSSTVTSIGEGTFRACEGLKSIVLPENLTNLARVSFYACSNLEEVVIRGSLTQLVDQIFTNCTALKKVTIPASVTALDGSTKNAFYKCTALAEINYGGTVEAWKALLDTNGDSYLKNSAITVTCSDGVYTYGADAQTIEGESGNVNWEFTTLDGVLTLSAKPDTDGKTADYASADASVFAPYFSQIKTIVVESGVTHLGNFLFRSAAATTVTLPETLESIGNSCFRETALTSVTIPASVESIGTFAFLGAAELETVVIEGNITTLTERMFANCTKLTTITLPASLTTLTTSTSKGVERTAFVGCTALTTVNFGGTVEQWNTLVTSLPEGNDGVLQSSNLIAVCSDGRYQYGTGKLTYTSGVTGNVDWMLDYTTGVLTLTAQEGGDGKTADFSESTWENGPFYPYKDMITAVVVNEGVTYLGDSLMRGIQMKTVSLPDSLVTIAAGCFRGCNMTEIVIPKNVTEIGRTAFYECLYMTKLEIQGSLPHINDRVFMRCRQLNTIIMPDTIAYIDRQAFNGDAAIREIQYNGTVDQWIELLAAMPPVAAPGVTEPTSGSSSLMKDYITVYCSDGKYVYGRMYISDDVYYIFDDSTGRLTIAGNGDIPSYEAGQSPWADFADQVTSVMFKNGITAVGSNAFGECTNLETVIHMGSAAQWADIKATAGSGNDPLFNATYISGTAGKAGDNVTWTFDPDTGIMTISGEGDMYDYADRFSTPWYTVLAEITSVVVEEGVTYIGTYTFQYALLVSDLELASSVKAIGSYSFGNCSALTEVKLPEGVVSIGAKAFTGCVGLTTIHLPHTLKYIDMKCFESDASLSDVYYNGTAAEWDLVEVSLQAQGNSPLLNANIHVLDDKVISDVCTDVAADDWYAADVMYLVNNGLLVIDNSTFSPAETDNLNFILELLYVRSGSSGMYATAYQWAVEQDIVAENVAENVDQTVSLNELALMLYKTAVYNGQTPAGGEEAALAWCSDQGYAAKLMAADANIDPDRALTRGEVSSVVAAYLGSNSGTADRQEQILATIKDVISNGGDGKMYIMSLDVTTGTADAKAGDGTLIVLPNGEVMLIDTMHTWGKDRVLELLKGAGVTSIDHFVISHPHSDHIGNAEAIVDYIYNNGGTIGNYYSADLRAYGSAEGTLISNLTNRGVTMHLGLRAGDQLTIGGVVIDIFNPDDDLLKATTGTGDEDVNNLSMLMKFTYGTSTYLTGGDLYMGRESALLDLYGDKLQADVMKANHHGVYTSNGKDWIATVDPQIIFAPADDIGDSVLMRYVSAQGCAYYSNGLDGLILISMDNQDNFNVVTRYDSYMRSGYQSETTEPEEVTEITIKVEVPEGWENPSIWAWDNAGNNAFETWPGLSLTQGEDGFWYATIPAWVENIIISANGGSVQTDDLALAKTKVDVNVKVTLAADGTVNAEMEYSSPNTGDETALVSAAAVMLLAAMGVVAVVKSKKFF